MKMSSIVIPFTLLIEMAGVATAYTQIQPPATPAAAIHKWVVPVPPATLLRLLPAAPDEWQLQQSHANNFVMEWASSQAQREFKYTPPTVAGEPPPPPMSLRFTLTDTGYYTGLFGDFGNLQAARNGQVETLMLDGFPARVQSLGKTGERLRLLVNSRYVLQIDTQNQPAKSVLKWVRLVDSAKLALLPQDGEEKLPRPFPIVRIDELNPRNNSTSQARWSTQEELDATAKGH